MLNSDCSLLLPYRDCTTISAGGIHVTIEQDEPGGPESAVILLIDDLPLVIQYLQSVLRAYRESQSPQR